MRKIRSLEDINVNVKIKPTYYLKNVKVKKEKTMAFPKKYEEEDFKRLLRKEVTTKDLAVKYGTTINAVRLAVKHRGLYTRQRKIKIKSPYGEKITKSIQECAEELGLSITWVRHALKGGRVKLLEEMEITLEEIKDV